MDYDRETLVAELQKRGITYLAPSDAVAQESFTSPASLLVALIGQPDSRLRLALVPLFIRHPELADEVPDVVTQLDPDAVLELQTLYMAAVYLQRHWWTQLSFYLDNMTPLPDLFSEEMDLPPADENFGKTGLHDLAEAWKARSYYPYNRLAALTRTMDLFFSQLRLEASHRQHAAKG